MKKIVLVLAITIIGVVAVSAFLPRKGYAVNLLSPPSSACSSGGHHKEQICDHPGAPGGHP